MAEKTSKVGTLEFTVLMRPVSWKRPAGSKVRYDAQLSDKVAFSAKALTAIRQDLEAYQSFQAAGKPLFKREDLTVRLFFSFKDKKDLRQDLDNLVKFTLDALQSQLLEGLIWTDDRQVTKLIASKSVGTDDFITVHIEPAQNT